MCTFVKYKFAKASAALRTMSQRNVVGLFIKNLTNVVHSLSEMQIADCSTCIRCCCCNRTVSGYDFVVNAVWPEVVANIEAKTPSIFAPGNPNVFHEVCNCKQVTRTVCLISLMNYSQLSSLYGRPHKVCGNSTANYHFLQNIDIFHIS